MDTFTLEHMFAWIIRMFREDERDHAFEEMRKLYDSDPEYWYKQDYPYLARSAGVMPTDSPERWTCGIVPQRY